MLKGIAGELVSRPFLLSKKYMKNQNTSEPSAYKINLLIQPNWLNILKWHFRKEVKNKKDKDVEKFISEYIKKNKPDEAQSLFYRKNINFIEFCDMISGMNQFWLYSNHYEEFHIHPSLEIWGYPFMDEEMNILDKRIEEDIHPYGTSLKMCISPQHIEDCEETISQIPYDDIVNLLVEIQKKLVCADHEILKFPKKYQDFFDKNNILYIPEFDIDTEDDKKKGSMNSDIKNWLKDSRFKDDEIMKAQLDWLEENGIEIGKNSVRYHCFKTPSYSIQFYIEFFDTSEPRLNTTDLSIVY